MCSNTTLYVVQTCAECVCLVSLKGHWARPGVCATGLHMAPTAVRSCVVGGAMTLPV